MGLADGGLVCSVLNFSTDPSKALHKSLAHTLSASYRQGGHTQEASRTHTRDVFSALRMTGDQTTRRAGPRSADAVCFTRLLVITLPLAMQTGNWHGKQSNGRNKC